MAAIHYRFLNRDTPTVSTNKLHSALDQTLTLDIGNDQTLRQSVFERRQLADDGHHVVLNRTSRTEDWLFADVLRSEPDAQFASVREGDSQEYLSVEQYLVPEGDSPLRGSMYVLIYGDHVLYSSRGQISSKCLETYLTWLLQKQPRVLSAEHRLILETRIPRTERMRATSARISLTSLSEVQPVERPVDQAPVPHIERQPASQSILSTLMVTNADLGQMIADGQVEVDVLLKFKTGGRKRPMNVGDLNRAFRNVEDADDITFDGPDGPVSAIGTRLRGTKSIETNGSLYDADDARRKLLEQFDEWRQQGHIENI
ncbi:hypothetical protein VSX64_14485 [Aurantimonas sp. C2-6-R+9]|uniref:hypothetical protein n=1 Tax=unclassified Aurantimonas TaxID=2638230 RepID=UPI002E195465|nr:MULTISPECIES: hypothetical protein [unclassified Aurantimonas]MEC5291963.1 hypothetical protein [Aurantimonas sp. C2-3-R2]MEC5382075.1 hypothetical protein [Aurantimonas sp. C2-6-R+9]MEC5413049.1 hypothetical protein [Aurantimonas sp. C2-4-R8]